MGVSASVTVPGELSSEETSLLMSELRAVGLDVDEIDTGASRVIGIDDALIVAVLVVPISAFFHELGKRAGADAYNGLKHLVSRLRGSRSHGGQGIVVLQDQNSGARVDMAPG